MAEAGKKRAEKRRAHTRALGFPASAHKLGGGEARESEPRHVVVREVEWGEQGHHLGWQGSPR